jgi:hypothetical protein
VRRKRVCERACSAAIVICSASSCSAAALIGSDADEAAAPSERALVAGESHAEAEAEAAVESVLRVGGGWGVGQGRV